MEKKRMQLNEQLETSGEHAILEQGKVGVLEGILTVPPNRNKQYMAFLAHPHSLQGGTMNNKVVTTMARALKELGIASLRFNCRGVGNSFGQYDHGIGESEDLIAIVSQWLKQYPETQLILCGFSFGSYVVYRTAAAFKGCILITIAPPVHHYDYTLKIEPKSWVILQGDEDEVVPYDLVKHFATHHHPPIQLIEFAKTGHFFHGQLIPLKTQLIDYISKQVQSL